MALDVSPKLDVFHLLLLYKPYNVQFEINTIQHILQNIMIDLCVVVKINIIVIYNNCLYYVNTF